MSRTEDFVRKQGWEYKRIESHNGPQLLVKVCPFCYDNKGTHFYLKDGYNGVFVCHKCGVSGSLDDLMEHVGDIKPVSTPFKEHEIAGTTEQAAKIYLQAHYDLLKNPKFRPELEWLIKKRRIGVSTLRQFRIGARENYGKKWITFPYFVDGEIQCTKERTIGKDFVHLYFTDNKGGPLYNEDNVGDKSTIIITEGEMDALALISLGIKSVCSVSNGSSYINSQWLSVLKDIKKVYLAYDGDNKGRIGAENFAKQLGLERCYLLPFNEDVKDANDFVMGSGVDYRDTDSIRNVRSDFVDRFIKTARPIDIEGVISVESALIDLMQHGSILEPSELSTPWQCINNLLERGGFSGGDLVVVTANPGIGKTTWALNIAHHLSKKDIPNLFYELEFSPSRLVKKLVCLDQGIERVTVENLMKAHSDLGNLPMYFGYRTTSLDIDRAVETMRAAFNRYTLQFVVFDHLHFLIRSMRYETQELSLACRTFKDLAVELNVPILLICHLSKIPVEARGRRREPDAEDLRGSKMLWADADYVFLLHREKHSGADAINSLQGDFHTLKKKNPGLISIKDLQDFADEGTLQQLKGVGNRVEERIKSAAEQAGNFEELLDIYQSTTKIILQKNRFGPGGVRTLEYDGAKAIFKEA